MDNIEISDKSIHIFSGVDLDILDAPSWLPKANFSRTETDLIATRNNGEDVKFVDYFTNHNLPSIQTENGLLLKGSLLDALAGSLAPGQYVQATGGGTLSIGEVSSIKGVAKATRIDGNIFTLSNGDPVFKGDVIETEGSGSVGLVFLDKTTMSLSDGGKMVLDELVYDPSTGAGSMAVDMLEGAFSFVSGEIAKTGPDAMSVSTPVATIGIRGTTVAGKAAVEGNDNSFTLLQDAEGGVGQISITNSAGTQTLSEVGATTTIASFNIAPPPPIILTAAQIQADYGTALAVLPPTPAVAPQPQAPPLPQEQQQEQQQEEEAATEEEEEGEEAVAEEVASEEGGEEELVEGELGSDGELSAEGEEGLGPDGEVLAEGGPPIGPDGEVLVEGGPRIGPDGEVLSEGGPPIGPDGEVLAEGGPPIGPDGELLIEGSGNILSPEEVAANEAFETAMADGATPEEAMAAAAAAGGLDALSGDFSRGPDSIPLAENLIGEPLVPGGEFGESIFGESIGGFGDEPFGGPALDLGGPGDFGNPIGGTGIELGGPGYLDGPMEFGDPRFEIGMSGGEGLGQLDGPGGVISDQFMGAQAPGAASFGPIGQVTNFIFGPDPIGQANMGFSSGFSGIPYGGRIESFSGGLSGQPFGGGFGGEPFGGGFGGEPFGGGFGGEPFGGGFGEDFYMNENYYEEYYYEDSSFFDDDSSSTDSSSSETFSGTNSGDTMNYNTYTSSVTLKGFSGDDTLYGGSAADILFGGLGSDNLTGNGGSDQFYFITGDGGDTISDFSVSDFFVYGGSITSSYSRSSFESDSGSSGNKYDLSSNGNNIPYVFNFTTNINQYGTASTVASALSNFSVTTDGSNAVSSSDSYLVVTGNSTNSSVYLWEDTGNGAIASSELSSLATLSNFDNDTLTGSEFSFETLSV